MSEAATPSAFPWRTFGPILAVHFLGTLGFSLAIPFLVFVVTDLGGASWTYGFVGATYSAFQLVGAPILGRWSDRTGRRPVLVASQVGTMSAWVLFLVALSIPKTELTEFSGAVLTIPLILVFVARALDGATGGNISVANAYVADLTRDTPDVRDVAFGRMGMASSLGFVLGPTIAGLLGGTAWGPRLPIALAAVVSAATTVAIVAWLKEPPGRCETGPPDPDMVDAGLYQQGKPCHRAPPPPPPKATLQRPEVRAVVTATFILFLGFNFFYAGFPVHAAAVYGWNITELGAFFGLIGLTMMFAQGPLLGWASRNFSHRTVFAAGVTVLVISMVSYEIGSGAMIYLGGVCFSIGNGLSWPTFQARVAEVAGKEQGTVQGLVTSMGSLASIGGLMVGGVLYPSLGGNLFLIGAAMFAVVVLLTPVWFPVAAAGTPAED